MPVVRDAVRPLLRTHTLIDVAAALDELIEEGDARWENGVAEYGWPSHPGDVWDPCAAGTNRIKEEGDDTPQPKFASFGTYLPITCSTISIGDPTEFAGRAMVALEAREAWLVEHQLATGDFKIDVTEQNPHLSDENAQIVAGGPFSLREGLAQIEEAIADKRQGGVIHAPVGIVSGWTALGDVLVRDTVVLPSGIEASILRTLATWTPVVAGGGYQDVVPENGTALTQIDQQYVWATYGVRVFRGRRELIPGDVSAGISREDNVAEFRAERQFLIEFEAPKTGADGWDGGLQAAVLIDRSL